MPRARLGGLEEPHWLQMRRGWALGMGQSVCCTSASREGRAGGETVPPAWENVQGLRLPAAGLRVCSKKDEEPGGTFDNRAV